MSRIQYTFQLKFLHLMSTLNSSPLLENAAKTVTGQNNGHQDSCLGSMFFLCCYCPRVQVYALKNLEFLLKCSLDFLAEMQIFLKSLQLVSTIVQESSDYGISIYFLFGVLSKI